MTDYTPEEMEKMFGVDPSIKEAHGFSVGDTVVAVEDDPGEDHYFYEGDEGVILGFAKVGLAKDPALAEMFGNDPAGGTYPVVEFDGMDPEMVRHYDVLEAT